MPPADLIRFSPEDLDLFSAASGDRNPIHCSEAYAATTTYGQRLAFGALGAVACLGKLVLPVDSGIERIVADFQRPMFAGVDYTVRTATPGGHISVRLFDGSVPVMALSVFPGARNDSVPAAQNASLPGQFEYSMAVDRQASDIVPGLTLQGQHRADEGAAGRLRERWGVSAPEFVLRTLLWGSYFTGMEMPGKYAVFFRFAVTFSPEGQYDPSLPLDYEAVVKRIDPRLQQIRTEVRLLQNECPMAAGECLSFIRASLSNPAGEDVDCYMQPSDDLAGKVALVIGASRGLGAATVRLLASQGARVIATARSPIESGFAQDGRISTASGNASDAAWMQQLLEQITAEHGRLDFLVCNAFPPIVSLRLEPNGLGRIQAYVQQAVAMVLTPLGCFLDLLNQSGGCAVIVSSSAVQSPVREWPHYIAAKQAIEGLAAVAPLQYSQVSALVVRPQKLLTEMINTPMGRKGAVAPGVMAARIVERLKRAPAAGTTEMLEAE